MAADILHCTVEEAKARLSSQEATGWMGYFRLKSIEHHERTAKGGKGVKFAWKQWIETPDHISFGMKLS